MVLYGPGDHVIGKTPIRPCTVLFGPHLGNSPALPGPLKGLNFHLFPVLTGGVNEQGSG